MSIRLHFDYISITYYAHLFRKLSNWLWHFARNFDISPEMSIHFWYFSRINWYFSRNANLFPPINYKIKIHSFYQIIMHSFYHQIVSFSPYKMFWRRYVFPLAGLWVIVRIIVHIDCYNIIAPRIRSTQKEGLYGSQKGFEEAVLPAMVNV